MAETQARSTIHGRRVLCGVPSEHCVGANIQTSTGHFSGHVKAHGSCEAAFKCHATWLLKQGFTQIGGREFASPANGPIRVLTKKSKFGCSFRPGKARWMQEGTGGVFINL